MTAAQLTDQNQQVSRRAQMVAKPAATHQGQRQQRQANERHQVYRACRYCRADGKQWTGGRPDGRARKPWKNLRAYDRGQRYDADAENRSLMVHSNRYKVGEFMVHGSTVGVRDRMLRP
jgi:hypothetical protein